MKGRIIAVGLLAVITAGQVQGTAATIARWDFNSAPPDASTATGSAEPAVGVGTASLAGGVTGSFAGGTGRDPGADNTGWSTAGYPAAGAANKTAGVEFRVSTRGYSNIVVSWDQRLSGSASRYARLQYSVTGTNFVDASAIVVPTNNTFVVQTVSLAGLAGVNDNANFAMRIVTEFESSATGSGAAGYVTPLGAAYSGSGTIRFDLLEIAGTPLRTNNAPPSIQAVPDQHTIESQPTTGIPIALSDDATPAANLRLRGSSSNPTLIPDAQLVFSGTGPVRTLTITPAPGQFGQATVTLTVSDGENLTATTSFVVLVSPLNAPPVIGPLAHQRLIARQAADPVAITVSDLETAAAGLHLTASSSNPTLISSDGLILGGAGEARTLTLHPASGMTGTALITVRVEDAGGRSASSSFVLTVVPSSGALFTESFGYADGSLVTNSAGWWSTHGGTTGQVQSAAGGVALGASRTEDVHLLIPAGARDQGTLYAAFTVTFSTLPGANEYFWHLNHAGGFRARVFAGTNNAAPGTFRLGVGNGGATGIGQAPVDLLVDTAYTVVVRYEVSSAQTALWINPASESAAPALATDGASGVPITSVSLRNNSGIGALRLAWLRLGTAFADVIEPPAERLSVVAAGALIEVSWPASASGYRLQSNTGTSAGGWVNESTTPAASGDRWVVKVPKTGPQKFFRLAR